MKSNRITPEFVNKLDKGEVFVFGSNLSGLHGGGAAKTAMKWGAVYGQAEGLQGMTYAIPTKDSQVIKALPYAEVYKHVEKFIEFAKNNKQLHFLVTEVGCGLAGLDHNIVGAFFSEAKDLENVSLPSRFWDVINFTENLKGK